MLSFACLYLFEYLRGIKETRLYYETSHHTIYIVCHLTICHYDYGTATNQI